MPFTSTVIAQALNYSFRDSGATVLLCDEVGVCTGFPGDSISTTLNELSVSPYNIRKGISDANWDLWTLSDGAMVTYGSSISYSPVAIDTITHFVIDNDDTPGGGHQFWAELSYPITTASGVGIFWRNDQGLRIKLTGDFFCNGATGGPLGNTANTAAQFLESFKSNIGVQMWSSALTDKYIGLSETVPNASGFNITELSGNNYSRTSIDGNDWSINAASSFGLLGQAARTNSTRTFPTASADWNEVNGWFIITTASGTGAIYAAGPLDSPVTVKSGEAPSFLASEFVAAIY